MTRPLARLAFAAALAFLAAGAAPFVYHIYGSQWWYMAATRGSHGQEVYEGNLRRAVEMDPTNGFASLRLASMYNLAGKPGMALDLQEKGMAGFRPLRGYLQLAGISEKLGKTDEAANAYDRVLLMNPANRDALERAAAMAYRVGNSPRLQLFARRILQLDPANLNATYLLAAEADRAGNASAAFNWYVKTSALLSRHSPESGRLVFEPAQVESRLHDLGKRFSQS